MAGDEFLPLATLAQKKIGREGFSAVGFEARANGSHRTLEVRAKRRRTLLEVRYEIAPASL
jgi:hypothetical protein